MEIYYNTKLINQMHEIISQIIQRKSLVTGKFNLDLRNKQKPPNGKWRFWLIMAGRGFGKTLAGASCIVQWIQDKKKQKICLVGGTHHDVRQVMLNGPSGIFNLCDTLKIKYRYYSSQNLVKFENGVEVFTFSSEKPDSLRGFQFDGVWADELAKFNRHSEVLEQLIFCCRIGNPQFVITTTPRPIKTLYDLIKRKDCTVVTGSSYENKKNLPKTYVDLISEFENTPLGNQEIYGQIIENSTHSPWHGVKIQYHTMESKKLIHYTLGIDPSVRDNNISGRNGSATGIVMIAYDTIAQKIVVLEDFSINQKVSNWISYVCNLISAYNIDYLAIETNQGGGLLQYTIQSHCTSKINIETYFARESKRDRALPIACLYAKGFIVHEKPLNELEKEMRFFEGTLDRVDALVWAVESILKKVNTPSIKHINPIWLI